MGVKMTASMHWSRISYWSVRFLNGKSPKCEKRWIYQSQRWISQGLWWIKERRGFQNDCLDELISNIILVGPIPQWKLSKKQKRVHTSRFCQFRRDMVDDNMRHAIAYHLGVVVASMRPNVISWKDIGLKIHHFERWTCPFAWNSRVLTILRIPPPTLCVTPLPATCGRLAWNLYIYLSAFQPPISQACSRLWKNQKIWCGSLRWGML